MRPGVLGELIGESGHVGDFYWRPVGADTEVYRIETTNKGFAVETIANFHGRPDVRLERVAAFIGYLQDEEKAVAETV